MAGSATSVSLTSTAQYYDWTGSTVVSDVQAWVSGTASNYGWRIKDTVTHSATSKESDFQQREASGADASHRPKLVITYI
jgi:hypothetical protein